MRIIDVATLTPLEIFLYWVRERDSIYLRRQSDAPKPWTDDEVLQNYCFANPYRASDNGGSVRMAVALWASSGVCQRSSASRPPAWPHAATRRTTPPTDSRVGNITLSHFHFASTGHSRTLGRPVACGPSSRAFSQCERLGCSIWLLARHPPVDGRDIVAGIRCD